MAEIRHYPGKKYSAAVVDADTPFRAFYCDTTGTVVLQDWSGDTAQFDNLAAGIVHPIGGQKILAGTTAGIVLIR